MLKSIYKITNNISGLCYIGKTTRPVEIRWKEHLYDFEIYKAAKKHLFHCIMLLKRME